MLYLYSPQRRYAVASVGEENQKRNTADLGLDLVSFRFRLVCPMPHFLFWTASSEVCLPSNRACGIDYRRQQGAAYVTIIARTYLAYIYPCKKLLSSRLQLSLYKHKTFRMISDGVGVIVRSAEAARQGRSLPGTDT